MKKIFYLVAALAALQTQAWEQQRLSPTKQVAGLPNDTNKIKILAELAIGLREKAPETGMSYARAGLLLSKQLGWHQADAALNRGLGVNYIFVSRYDMALQHLQRALEIDSANQDAAGMARDLGYIGELYAHTGKYPKAAKNYLKSLAISERNKDSKITARVYSGMSNVCRHREAYGRSLEYARKSIALAVKIGDSGLIADNLVNAGKLLLSLKKYDSALWHFERSLGIEERIDALDGIADCHLQIGVTYEQMNEPDSAFFHLRQAVRVYNIVGNKGGAASASGMLGLWYLQKSKISGNIAQLSEARRLLYAAVQQLQDSRRIEDLAKYLKILAEVEEKNGDYKKANEYNRAFHLYHDSVNSGLVKLKLVELENERTRDLSAQQREIALLKKNSHRKERNYTLAGLAVVLVAGGLVIRSLNREKRFTKERLKSNEHRFQKLIESGFGMMGVISKNHLLKYVSPTVEKVLGFTAQELTDKDPTELVHQEDMSNVAAWLEEAWQAPPEKATHVSFRALHKEGHWVWVDGTMTNMESDETIGGLLGSFYDVTPRKKAEEEADRFSRINTFVGKINQAIVHAENEDHLFKTICEIGVQDNQFKALSILAVNEDKQTLELLAQAGMPAKLLPDLKSKPIIKDSPLEQTLSRKTCTAWNDLVAESGDEKYRKLGWNSTTIIPIFKSGKVYALLSVISEKKHYFTDPLRAALRDVAADVSFALEAFEKEQAKIESQQQLQHSQARLTEVQQIAHLGSWELSFDSGIATWSQESLRIYGLPENNPTHDFQTWVSFIHPEDKAYVMEQVAALEQTQKPAAFYHRILRRDGSVRYIFSQARFAIDASGKPASIWGVAHDVTDLKQTELALAQSEANLRLTLDLIPQSVYAVEEDGSIVFANKSFASLCALDPEAVLGKNIRGIVPAGNDVNHFMQDLLAVLSSDEVSISSELPFLDAKGKTHILYCTKIKFTPAGSLCPVALGVASDITEIRAVSAERDQIILDVIRRNNDLEQFSYIVSHNLRAHLANILGITNLLEMGLVEKEEEETLLTELGTTSKKLDRVVRDINTTLQVRTGISEKKENVCLSSLVKEATESIYALRGEANFEIRSNFSGGDKIVTIRSYLYSIFLNLISNSIKYARPEVTPEIEISSRKAEWGVELMFRDNGLGFEQKKYGDQIFGLYKRFHTHAEGRGMGLFMVKTQVEALGGSVKVESVPNNGTTFTITFVNS